MSANLLATATTIPQVSIILHCQQTAEISLIFFTSLITSNHLTLRRSCSIFHNSVKPCRISELQRRRQLDERIPRQNNGGEKTAEIPVPQSQQDCSPFQGIPVCSWASLCLTRQGVHCGLGQACLIHSKVKNFTGKSPLDKLMRKNTKSGLKMYLYCLKLYHICHTATPNLNVFYVTNTR